MTRIEQLNELKSIYNDFTKQIEQIQQQDAKNSNELSQQQAELAYCHQQLANIDTKIKQLHSEY